MTEKRFTVPDRYQFSHSKVQLKNGEPLTNEEIVRLLNVNDGAFIENFALLQSNQEYRKENEQLKKENKELKQQLSDIDKLINDLGSEEMCRQYDEIIGDVE